MDLTKLSDKEILKIANPIWDNIAYSSNKQDYDSFSKDLSKEAKKLATRDLIIKQWIILYRIYT